MTRIRLLDGVDGEEADRVDGFFDQRGVRGCLLDGFDGGGGADGGGEAAAEGEGGWVSVMS